MEKFISCCGVICSDCEYFPHDCKGCPEMKGKVFWLQFTGEAIYQLYDCCINQKRNEHCGKCPSLPCEHYNKDNPIKSREENQMILEKQLKNLSQM